MLYTSVLFGENLNQGCFSCIKYELRFLLVVVAKIWVTTKNYFMILNTPLFFRAPTQGNHAFSMVRTPYSSNHMGEENTSCLQ